MDTPSDARRQSYTARVEGDGEAAGGGQADPLAGFGRLVALLLIAQVSICAVQAFRIRAYPPETHIGISTAWTIVHAFDGPEYRSFNPVRGIVQPLCLAAMHLACPGSRYDPISPWVCNGLAILSLLAFLAGTWVFLRLFLPPCVAGVGTLAVSLIEQVSENGVWLTIDVQGAAVYVWACVAWARCRLRGTRSYLWVSPFLLTLAVCTRQANFIGLGVLAFAEAAWDMIPDLRRGRPLRPFVSRVARMALLVVAPVAAYVGLFATVRSAFTLTGASWWDSARSIVGHNLWAYHENIQGSGEAIARPLSFVRQEAWMVGASGVFLFALGLVRAGRQRGVAGAWPPLAVLALLPLCGFCFVEKQTVRFLLPYLPAIWGVQMAGLDALLRRASSLQRVLLLGLVLAQPVYRAVAWHPSAWGHLRTLDYAERAMGRISEATRGARRVIWWGGWVNIGHPDHRGEVIHFYPPAMSAVAGRVIEERFARRPAFHAEGAGWPARIPRGVLPAARSGEAWLLPWTFEKETYVERGLAFEVLRFRIREGRAGPPDAEGVVRYLLPDGTAVAEYAPGPPGVGPRTGRLLCGIPGLEYYAEDEVLGFSSNTPQSYALPEAPGTVTAVEVLAVGVVAESLFD